MTIIDIRLFGPVRVRRAGSALLLGGDFRRAIVARLAVEPGEPVSTAELVDGLWARPPGAAVSSLRAQISRLRQGAIGEALRGGRGGYLLDPALVSTDLGRLGDWASSQLGVGIDEALAEVAGRGLADLDGFPFVPGARTQLTVARSRAVERIARGLLAAGHAERALTALTGLAAEGQEVGEPAVLLAAEASARLGRSSEALRLLDAGAGGASAPPTDQALRLRESIVRFDPAVSPARPSATTPEMRRGMPLPVSTFVGRTAELEALAAARGGARLVTLVGPAGVGKSRLALESARRVGDERDDAQWHLDLAPFTSAVQVVDALGDLLRVPSSSGTHRPEQGAPPCVPDEVVRRLDGRRTLLVLDNVEHLRETVSALVLELLTRCAGLTVLVTTREALRLPGERLVPVSPLPTVPDAEALFFARAADVVPDLASDPAAASAVSAVRAICAGLDGLPLAIELAAARLDVLGLDELRAAVEGDALLDAAPGVHPRRGAAAQASNAARGAHAGPTEAGTSGASGTPATLATSGVGGRRGSLRGAIRWSVDLLAPGERLLLRQLAWFSGPFALDAVEAICRSEVGPARALLLELTRKSLVARDEAGGSGAAEGDGAGPRRFRLLRAVRAFLLDDEVQNDGCPAVRAAWLRRHREWFAGWVGRVDPGLRGPRSAELHARLDAAAPDLALATGGALAAGERETALRLAGGQAWHAFRRGRFDRAVTLVEQALALPGPAHPLTLARAHLGAAMNLQRRGDEPGAERHAHAGAEAARASGDPGWIALFEACEGAWAAATGRVAEHDERMARALALLDDAAPWQASELHLFRGIAKGRLGKPAQALEAFAEAHRLARACGHDWAAENAAERMAQLYIGLRRGGDAVSHLRSAVRRSAAAGDLHAVVTSLHTGAGAFALLERHRDGAALLGVVDTAVETLGYDARSLEPVHRRAYRERVRQALPPAEWRREYARGRALPLAAAIRLLDPASAS